MLSELQILNKTEQKALLKQEPLRFLTSKESVMVLLTKIKLLSVTKTYHESYYIELSFVVESRFT